MQSDAVEIVEPDLPDEIVVDETEDDKTVAPVQYDITSYGADIDAEGFVSRLRRGDVFIPPFQRDYVWTQREASRFIESLLLGLPVPGIFLARQRDSKRLLVIDGQQRLKTLQFFFDGYFDPREGAKRKRVFELQGVQEEFEGKTYETLSDDDRIILNDSIIHATIVKQELPQDEDSSIYHIFERLNTMGRKLSPQQIRAAIYHGFLIDVLHDLNDYPAWRDIYGRRSKTLKDEELILRFIALYDFSDQYTSPMKEFLNGSTERLIRGGREEIQSREDLFKSTIDFISSSVGASSFRLEKAINAAVYDSVMVGAARRLDKEPRPEEADFSTAHKKLLETEEYVELVSKATANEKNVARRLELATSAFRDI